MASSSTVEEAKAKAKDEYALPTVWKAATNMGGN